MTNSYPFQIGQDQGIPERFFDGIIDDVHIYNRALTESEIQDDMGCGTGELKGYVKDAETGEVIEREPPSPLFLEIM